MLKMQMGGVKKCEFLLWNPTPDNIDNPRSKHFSNFFPGIVFWRLFSRFLLGGSLFHLNPYLSQIP